MVRSIGSATLAAIGVIGIATGAQASAYLFQFDDAGLYANPAGFLTSPLVGGGFLSTSATLGEGLYALDSLPDLNLSFSVSGISYSIGDIATPIDGVAVEIEPGFGKDRLVFTENPAAPLDEQDGGLFGGSLDLINNDSDFLSFEPSDFGGNNLYIESGGGTIGNYLALAGSVPEPGTWAMILVGFGVVGASRRAVRRSAIANG